MIAKEVWIGWVSSSVEAYNMAIYSFLAPFLAHFLFLHSSEKEAVFFSYTLLLIASCLLYPLGALYYGRLGDEKGRQKTCIYSTLGLGVATGLIGLFPFHFLGDNLWIYVLVCIGAQHFFSGGEYHGSIVFSLEHGKTTQSAIMSCFCCLFAVFGLVIASTLASIASIYEKELWIRVCFLVGFAGSLLSYLLKKYCKETPEFTALSKELLTQVKWGHFIKSEWKTIGTTVLVLAFFIVSYTFIFITLPVLQETAKGFDTLRSLMIYGVSLATAGLFAARFGTKKILLTGLLLFSGVVIPLCHFVNNLQTIQITLTLFASLVIGPIHSWMIDQFKVEHRCKGIFLSSAIATSLFGGSTTPICLLLFDASSSLVTCACYPLVISLSALLCLTLHKQRKQVFA